tara:strand:+ start:538 stop:687 length:150 start_codon:yes stop_codon:yes gene_type:complete
MKLERKSSTEDIIITVPRKYAHQWVKWLEDHMKSWDDCENTIINIRREW